MRVDTFTAWFSSTGKSITDIVLKSTKSVLFKTVFRILLPVLEHFGFFWPLCLQHSIPMADDGVGDSIFLLSYFRKLLYRKQNIQGCTPVQPGHHYQLYIYDAFHLSKRFTSPSTTAKSGLHLAKKRLVMVMIPMVKNSFFFTTFLFRRRSTHFQSLICVSWHAGCTDQLVGSIYPHPKNLRSGETFLGCSPP